jgi:hypothetical protein
MPLPLTALQLQPAVHPQRSERWRGTGADGIKPKKEQPLSGRPPAAGTPAASTSIIKAKQMLHETAVLLFSITAGFTCSGIVANVYRLVNGKKDRFGRSVYLATMVVAGPSELFERTASSWRQKKCSWIAFWLAAAVAGYWSFVLGLLVIQVALALV